MGPLCGLRLEQNAFLTLNKNNNMPVEKSIKHKGPLTSYIPVNGNCILNRSSYMTIVQFSMAIVINIVRPFEYDYQGKVSPVGT